jgi:hypothetical protein
MRDLQHYQTSERVKQEADSELLERRELEEMTSDQEESDNADTNYLKMPERDE